MLSEKEIFKNEVKKTLNSPKNKAAMEDIGQVLTSHKVFIYGAGNAGTMTFKLLQDANINIEAFLDKRGGQGAIYLGKPVYAADDSAISENHKKNSVVIVAFLCGSKEELDDIQKWLNSLGYGKTRYFQAINYLLMTNNLNRQNENITSFFGGAEEKILKTAKFFEDQESRIVYRSFLQAILSSNADDFASPCNQTQYFANDVPFKKGYLRFIDCGAFDGDTAMDLNRIKGQPEAIAFFEPENDNFKRLCKNIKNNRLAKVQILFPCGVWANSEMLRFRSGIQTSSGISQNGDVFVQCVALDDVLTDFAPTFIKMDIEGAEYEALIGAKNIIKKHKPDLAISVYHNIKHMWDIPLLIDSFTCGYKFYLRSHGLHGMETILYAVSDD